MLMKRRINAESTDNQPFNHQPSTTNNNQPYRIMNFLHTYSFIDWALILLSAFIIGLSKAGLKGIDMLNVTIMAIVFGGKTSTGIVLPLLCTADIMAVKYYHRHAQWPHFWKIIPWMIVGVLIGVYVGKDMNEALFRKIMATIIV